MYDITRVYCPRSLRCTTFVIVWVVLINSVQTGLTITVNYIAGFDQRNVVDNSDNPLVDGNDVRVGTFVDGFDVAGNAGDLMALDNAWVDFDSTVITTFVGQMGRFDGEGIQADASFDSQKIYLWILQTCDAGAPTSTFENVAEYGLYSGTGGNWFFPAEGTLPPGNTTTVTSDQVDQQFFGAIEVGSLKLGIAAGGPNCVEEFFEVDAGWNLISFPFCTTSTFLQIFDSIQDSIKFDSIWTWSAQQFAKVDPVLPPTESAAYWIYARTAAAAPIPAETACGTPPELAVGWNLFGPHDTVTNPTIESTINKTIWYWEHSQFRAVPGNTAGGVLEPGNGYWISSNAIQSYPP